MAGAKMHNSIVEEWRIPGDGYCAAKFLRRYSNKFTRKTRANGQLVETLIIQIETIVRLN